MSNERIVNDRLFEHQHAMLSVLNQKEKIHRAGVLTSFAALNGKVLICGNGGSAADAQHLAAEIVGRFKRDRRALSAIALTTDSSVITAIANDYGYEAVFERQVCALGSPEDVLICISTSGSSASVIHAAAAAKNRGMLVISLTGREGGELAKFSDVEIRVNSSDTAAIQECHLLIEHCIAEIVENAA